MLSWQWAVTGAAGLKPLCSPLSAPLYLYPTARRSVSASTQDQDRLRTLKSPIRITESGLSCASRFQFLSRVIKGVGAWWWCTLCVMIWHMRKVYLRFKRGQYESDSWETFSKWLRFPKTSSFVNPLNAIHLYSMHFIKSKEEQIIQSDYLEFCLCRRGEMHVS